MFQTEKIFYACGTPIIVAENSYGETHVYRASDRVQLSEANLKGGIVYGGSRGGECDSASVTMESGLLERLYGGGEGSTIHGPIDVRMSGGVITDTLYGAGIDDVVGDISITVTDGVIKRRCYAGGEARCCGDINMNFQRIVCNEVFTGVCNEHGVQRGSTRMDMRDGVILNLYCGATAPTEGTVDIMITGGYLEKKVVPCEVREGIHLRFYEGIRQSGGHDIVYPMIPEEIQVEWLPAEGNHLAMTQYQELDDKFYDTSDDKEKLVCRFFEIRDPEVPKYAARFPQFIGDCILIHFPSGAYMLIDTGMPYAAREITDGLKRLGVKKLDYFQVSHMHMDHMGCAQEIMRQFPVEMLILPKVRSILPMDIYKQMYIDFLETAEQCGIPLWRVMKGDRMTVGTGQMETLVEFLNPMESWAEEKDLNRSSIATRISYGDTVAMFGGDITNAVEESLSLEYGEKLSCDLLKASHHGIVSQCHYAYIDACAPQYVVIQNLREDGIFITATRYQLNHIHKIQDDKIFVTGICGRIKATLTGEKGGVYINTQYK